MSVWNHTNHSNFLAPEKIEDGGTTKRDATLVIHSSDINMSDVLRSLKANPLLLCQSLPDMKRRLYTGKAGAQGTGNQVTDQEASFAAVLEGHGFRLLGKGEVPVTTGRYYYYQWNGSQQSIDFRLVEFDGSKATLTLDCDLKHTLSDVFFLNDGWFHKDVLYIVSWNRTLSAPRKKKVTEPALFLALGQEIPTAEETACMKELLAIKQKYNTEFKGCGSLSTYIRFANRYSCKEFTPERTDKCFERVLTYASSASSASSSSVSAAVGGAGAKP